VRLSALPTGATSTGCNSDKRRSTPASENGARRRGGRGGGAGNPPSSGPPIIPARSSLANATRQLISFQWPLGERQSNHAHTRRDSAVRDNPGSLSKVPCSRFTNAGLNSCPQISTAAAYKIPTPRVQQKMWDTLS